MDESTLTILMGRTLTDEWVFNFFLGGLVWLPLIMK